MKYYSYQQDALPLNVSFNEEFKASMKANFSRWYANEVKEALDKRINIEDLKVNLRTPVVTHLHPNCLMLSTTSLNLSSISY